MIKELLARLCTLHEKNVLLAKKYVQRFNLV